MRKLPSQNSFFDQNLVVWLFVQHGYAWILPY